MDSAATLYPLGILIYQFLFTLPLFAMVYPLRVLPLLIIGIAMQVLNLRGLCFDEQVERTSRMWARPHVNLLIYVAAVLLGACHTLLFLFNPFHVALEHVEVVARLRARLQELRSTKFQPESDEQRIACETQVVKNGDFFGPWLPVAK